MKISIDEAKKELKKELNGNIPEDYPKTAAAIQLSTEALDFCKELQDTFPYLKRLKLPSQAEE